MAKNNKHKSDTLFKNMSTQPESVGDLSTNQTADGDAIMHDGGDEVSSSRIKRSKAAKPEVAGSRTTVVDGNGFLALSKIPIDIEDEEEEEDVEADAQADDTDESYKRLARLVVRGLSKDVRALPYVQGILQKQKIWLDFRLLETKAREDWAELAGGSVQEMAALRSVLRKAKVDTDWIQVSSAQNTKWIRDVTREIRGYIEKGGSIQHAFKELKKAISMDAEIVPGSDFVMEKSGYFSVILKRQSDVAKVLGKSFMSGASVVDLKNHDLIRIKHPLNMLIEDVGSATKGVLDKACRVYGACTSKLDLHGRFFVTYDDYSDAVRAICEWNAVNPFTLQRIPAPMFVLDRNTALTMRPQRSAMSTASNVAKEELNERDRALRTEFSAELMTIRDRMDRVDQGHSQTLSLLANLCKNVDNITNKLVGMEQGRALPSSERVRAFSEDLLLCLQTIGRMILTMTAAVGLSSIVKNFSNIDHARPRRVNPELCQTIPSKSSPGICVIQQKRCKVNSLRRMHSLLSSSLWCFLIVSCCLTVVSAAHVEGNMLGFTNFVVASWNMHGLCDGSKVAHMQEGIYKENPRVFVITEPGRPEAIAKVRWPKHRFVRTKGRLTQPRNITQAGVTIGYEADLPVVDFEVDLPGPLEHRMARLSLYRVIGSRGSKLTHVIGIYAPTGSRHEDDLAARDFWTELGVYVTGLVARKGGEVLLIGDFNIILRPSESTSTYMRQMRCDIYRSYLASTTSRDLWETKPSINIDRDWTWTSWAGQSTQTRSILDRAAVSGTDLMLASIETKDNFCPGTDHRMILVKVRSNVAADVRDGACERNPLPMRVKNPKFIPVESKVAWKVRTKDFIAEARAMNELCEVITNRVELEKNYSTIVRIIRQAEDFFGCRQQPKAHAVHAKTAAVRKILRDQRKLGSAIRRLRDGCSEAELIEDSGLREVLRSINTMGGSSTLEKAKSLRKDWAKALYQTQKLADIENAEKLERSRLQIMTATGSIKRFLPEADESSSPVALRAVDGSVRTRPSEIGRIISAYCGRLYTKPSMNVNVEDQPWLRSAICQDFRQRAASQPFVWPRLMEIQDVRSLLKKGNKTPTPGPDRCEKWVAAASGDDMLTEITKICNYIISSNVWPRRCNDSYLQMLFKKGDRLDLDNYRGLMFSNMLANLVASWFSVCLQDYSVCQGLLPDYQMATRPGVEMGDAASLLKHVLAAIGCSVNKDKSKHLYILQKDVAKGFDSQVPEGFYMACSFFGLPDSVIDFDKARLIASVQPITAVGLGPSFQVEGLQKQGDPPSPIKFCLTTGVSSWWIAEEMRKLSMSPGIDLFSAKLGVDISLNEIVQMDDTAFVADSPGKILFLNSLHERFQWTVGGRTSWAKSRLFTSSEARDSLLLDSTAQGGVTTSVELKFQDITEFEFVGAHPFDNTKHFEGLLRMIQGFRIPTTARQIPYQTLRKIFAVNLAAKLRAKIMIQPLSAAMASKLTKAIDSKVSGYIHWYGRMNKMRELRRPVQENGEGWFCVEAINRWAAVRRSQRDITSSFTGLRLLGLHRLWNGKGRQVSHWRMALDVMKQRGLVFWGMESVRPCAVIRNRLVGGERRAAPPRKRPRQEDPVQSTDSAKRLKPSEQRVGGTVSLQSTSKRTRDLISSWSSVPMFQTLDVRTGNESAFDEWVETEDKRQALYTMFQKLSQSVQEQIQASEHVNAFTEAVSSIETTPRVKESIRAWLESRPEASRERLRLHLEALVTQLRRARIHGTRQCLAKPPERARCNKVRAGPRTLFCQAHQARASKKDVQTVVDLPGALSGPETLQAPSSQPSVEQLETMVVDQPVAASDRRQRTESDANPTTELHQVEPSVWGLSRDSLQPVLNASEGSLSSDGHHLSASSDLFARICETSRERIQFEVQNSMVDIPQINFDTELVIATDASGIGDAVSSAVVGLDFDFSVTLDPTTRPQVGHGELYAVVMAMLFGVSRVRESLADCKIVIFTDYLSAVRLCEGTQKPAKSNPYAAWVKLLYDDVTREGFDVSVLHVTAHTNDLSTLSSRLNDKADAVAKRAHGDPIAMSRRSYYPVFAIPFGAPVEVTPCRDGTEAVMPLSLIEMARTAEVPGINIRSLFATPRPSNESKNVKGFTTKVLAEVKMHGYQSRLHDYQVRRHLNGDSVSPYCECAQIESTTHVFVHCSRYDVIKRQEIDRLMARIGLWEDFPDYMAAVVEGFFYDDARAWIGGISHWHFLEVPRVIDRISNPRRRGLYYWAFREAAFKCLGRIAGERWKAINPYVTGRRLR